MWVPRTLWCLLLTLQFICPFRCVAIGQCCVRLWKEHSRKPDHPSNFSTLQGLMRSDADPIGQVPSSCPQRRCSNVIKKNRLFSRHNWYIEGRLKNEKNSWATFAPHAPPQKKMKQQVVVFCPIRIIQRVQRAPTWKTVSHKRPIWLFNDVDWGSLMNVAKATHQDAAANQCSYISIY